MKRLGLLIPFVLLSSLAWSAPVKLPHNGIEGLWWSNADVKPMLKDLETAKEHKNLLDLKTQQLSLWKEKAQVQERITEQWKKGFTDMSNVAKDLFKNSTSLWKTVGAFILGAAVSVGIMFAVERAR